MSIAVGDVVRDQYSGRLMTVEAIDGHHAKTVWFDSENKLHRGSIFLFNLKVIDPTGG